MILMVEHMGLDSRLRAQSGSALRSTGPHSLPPLRDPEKGNPPDFQEGLAPYAELDTIRRNYRTALTRSYNSFQSITFFPVIPDFIMHAQKKDAHELYMQLIRPIMI